MAEEKQSNLFYITLTKLSVLILFFFTLSCDHTRRIADDVISLYMGELVEHGPAQQAFNNPRDERTRAYISGEIS